MPYIRIHSLQRRIENDAGNKSKLIEHLYEMESIFSRWHAVVKLFTADAMTVGESAHGTGLEKYIYVVVPRNEKNIENCQGHEAM